MITAFPLSAQNSSAVPLSSDGNSLLVRKTPNSLPLENTTEKLQFMPEWNFCYGKNKVFCKGANSSLTKFTIFSENSHFFTNLMLWSDFSPVSSGLLYRKTQPSTKSLPLCPLNPSTVFLRPLPLILSSTPCRKTSWVSHSCLVYRLSRLYFCNIWCPKEGTVEMSSLNQITSLHSHVSIYIFR